MTHKQLMNPVSCPLARVSARSKAIAWGVVLALAVNLTPAAVLGEDSLEARLKTALQQAPHKGVLAGVCVLDLAASRPLFQQSADLPLIPASSMKVFAMASATEELGANFAFETILATDGANLILIGDGDPGFGDRKLCNAQSQSITAGFDRWADTLLDEGVTLIPGDLVMDGSIFDDQRLHPTWEKEDLGKWYAAPVSGVNFNDNCLDITLTPSDTSGGLVSVSIIPDGVELLVINRCKTGGKGQPTLHHKPGTFEYIVSGKCNRRWPFGAVAFPDPEALCGRALRSSLAKKGISVAGEVRADRIRLPGGALPPGLYVIGRHETPMAEVLARAGKDSQNLFAECLLKRAGFAYAKRKGLTDPRGSWVSGASAVMETLKIAGIDTAKIVVADGSGLSRKNRCTARQLAATLAWVHRRPEGTLMRNSLSIAGVDGSLRTRLTDMPHRVYAKTGTMRGIRTLCGYIVGDDGAGYAFAIMFNGYTGPSTPYKEIQDRICRILADDLDRNRRVKASHAN